MLQTDTLNAMEEYVLEIMREAQDWVDREYVNQKYGRVLTHGEWQKIHALSQVQVSKKLVGPVKEKWVYFVAA